MVGSTVWHVVHDHQVLVLSPDEIFVTVRHPKEHDLIRYMTSRDIEKSANECSPLELVDVDPVPRSTFKDLVQLPTDRLREQTLLLNHPPIEERREVVAFTKTGLHVANQATSSLKFARGLLGLRDPPVAWC
jgi:hypothetical protein